MLLVRRLTCEEEDYRTVFFPNLTSFLGDLNFALCRVDGAAERVVTGKVRQAGILLLSLEIVTIVNSE